jgi:hypothetical protein
VGSPVDPEALINNPGQCIPEFSPENSRPWILRSNGPAIAYSPAEISPTTCYLVSLYPAQSLLINGGFDLKDDSDQIPVRQGGDEM